MRGDGLAFSGVAYLRALDRGLLFTRLGVGLLFSVWIGGIVLSLAVSLLTSGGALPWLRMLLVGVPSVLCIGLWALGWWMATTPDPSLGDPAGSRAPLSARWLAVVAGLYFAALTIIEPFVSGRLPFAGVGLGVVLLAQYACGAVVLRRLAARAGNRRAANQARQVWWATMIVAGSVATVLVTSLILSLFSSPAVTVVQTVLLLVNLAIFFVALVAIILQATAAGLIRDDLRRFLFHARNQREQEIHRA